VKPEVAFYCMSSEAYFPGAVAMINSLRLAGHREPLYLLDCGLTPAHAELLSREATIVPASSDTPPWLLKTIAPLTHPADVMVLIDADMIVTRPLTQLVERAARGHVLAFRNNMERHVAEWGEVLGLGELRRQPYVNSGLVFLGPPHARQVIRLLDDRQRLVEFERTILGSNESGYPLLLLDQDVLNAIFSSAVPRDAVVALDSRLAPNQPYAGLRLLDVERLRCAYRDGVEPFVVHQYLGKPWLKPMYHGIYSRLLVRLLFAPDVPLKVDESEVPLRLRPGLVAHLERRRVDALDLARWYLGEVIPERVRARLGRTRDEEADAA
jgi:hypothetical protein